MEINWTNRGPSLPSVASRWLSRLRHISLLKVRLFIHNLYYMIDYRMIEYCMIDYDMIDYDMIDYFIIDYVMIDYWYHIGCD